MRSATAIFAILVIACAAPGHGERTPSLIDQGLVARQAGHPERARILFESAYAQSKSPQALAQLALTEQQLEQWSAAEAHLTKALEAQTNGWIRRRDPFLRDALEDIRSHRQTPTD